jgi:hypothetical protein
MQFNFKFGSKQSPENKEKVNYVAVLGLFWRKIYKTVFFTFLFSVIALAGYIWQQSLTGGEWSVVKKQEYLDSQNKGIVFKENDYKKAYADVEMRKNSKNDDSRQIKDIFKAY